MEKIKNCFTNLIAYGLSRSAQPVQIPQPIQEILLTLQQRAVKYLSLELKTSLLYNFCLSLFFFTYIIPQKFIVYIQSQFILTIWLSSLCLLNFLAFFPKALIIWKLNTIQRQRFDDIFQEARQAQIIDLWASRAYAMNYKLSKSIFFIYSLGFLSVIVKFIMNYEIVQKILHSEKTPELNWICFFVLIGFLLRFVLSFKSFANIYYYNYLGVGGLQPNLIDKLKVVTITQELIEQIKFKESTCVICLEEFAVGQDIRYMNCQGKHYFHQQCVDKWLKTSSRCPCCNKVFDLPNNQN